MPGEATITEEEYLATQIQLCRLAGLARTLPLDRFLAAIERSEAIAPITNPSLWIAANRNLDKVKQLATALLRFQATANKLAGEVAHG